MCVTLRVYSTFNIGRLLSRIIRQNATLPELSVPVWAYKHASDYNVIEHSAANVYVHQLMHLFLSSREH